MQIYAKLDIVLVHVLELSPALKLHFTWTKQGVLLTSCGVPIAEQSYDLSSWPSTWQRMRTWNTSYGLSTEYNTGYGQKGTFVNKAKFFAFFKKVAFCP